VAAASASPLLRAYARLRQFRPECSAVICEAVAPEWLRGCDLVQPAHGKLAALLAVLARELGSDDRKVLAAAFALRVGRVSGIAIGPYLATHCVPEVTLDDIAIKLGPTVLLEHVALRSARFTGPGCNPRFARSRCANPHMRLLPHLRRVLCGLTEPVVDSLSLWSKLKRSALWGLVLSAWANEMAELGSGLGCQARALRLFPQLVQRDDAKFRLAPTLYLRQHQGETRICQIRGTCCLYYRTPAATRCASCPLPQHTEQHLSR
jgi:hypothetical protein